MTNFITPFKKNYYIFLPYFLYLFYCSHAADLAYCTHFWTSPFFDEFVIPFQVKTPYDKLHNPFQRKRFYDRFNNSFRLKITSDKPHNPFQKKIFYFFFGFVLTKENNRSLKLFKKADFKLMSIEIRNLNSFYLLWFKADVDSLFFIKESGRMVKQMSTTCFLFFSISAGRCVTLQIDQIQYKKGFQLSNSFNNQHISETVV